MAQNDHDLSVTIPEELRRQFLDVQRRLWRVETITAASWAAGGLILSFLALFISDRFWDTPPALRAAFLLTGLAVAAGAFYFWASRWVWNRRSMEDLSRLVQKRYRTLGDRLLGIVELSHERRHQANFSPELYHAAIQQVAQEAGKYDFRQSVSLRPAEKFAVGAISLVVCCLVIGAAIPQATWSALARWINPAAATPRYTLVTLDGLPRELIVPHGEPFVVSGEVHYRSFWKPASVTGKVLTANHLEGSVSDGRFHLQVPGQMETGPLRIRVGDATAEVKVSPVYRPALRELTAQIKLPAYLHYPDEDVAVQSGSFVALEGSAVSFHGKTSRTLASAEMQSASGQPAPLKIDGEAFASAPQELDGQGEYIFNWRDDLGLTNASPLRLAVASEKDAPPTAELPGMRRETAMLASDVLRIRTEASDDYGLEDLGLTWEVTSDTPLTESISTEVKIMTPSTHIKKAEHTFLWSPRTFRIPVDTTVDLQGYARDFFPGRERSRTPVYRIRILSPEEHAELVREQLEAVMARIEEVTRLQEKVSANLHDIHDNTKIPQNEAAARLAQSKADEMENAAHLDQLSQQAQAALGEAMKNPLIPEKNIRQWSESAHQWQKVASQKMPEAASAMQAAQQPSDSRQQQLADAAQKSDDILKDLEKTQDQASKHMDELQALTLAQRLRKVGGQEKEIGGQLLNSASNILGLPPEELPDKFKTFEHTLTTDQNHAEKESDSLQGEISRFFERTKKTNYGTVSQEMKEAHTTDELDKLSGMIGDNIAIEASGGLGQWSDRFAKWGDALEPKDEGKSGQGSSGQSGSKQKDLTKDLIALLRLRENEMTLRDQTTALDQNKGEPAAFQQRARSLSETQKSFEGKLDDVHRDAGVAQLEPAFAQAAASMDDSATVLQKPETGPSADAAEGKTVDALSDLINLINEEGQRSKQKSQGESQSSNAEEMAFLMRMMQSQNDKKGMAMQPATGPNSAGGRASGAGKSVGGNVTGKGAGARDVEKSSGVIENSPPEFRDALDNYFHALERTKD